MEISDQRKVGKIREKLVHALGGTAVSFDARVTPIGGLIRNRVFDDENIGAIPVPEQNAKTFSLVNFNGGNEQSPKRIG